MENVSNKTSSDLKTKHTFAINYICYGTFLFYCLADTDIYLKALQYKAIFISNTLYLLNIRSAIDFLI